MKCTSRSDSEWNKKCVSGRLYFNPQQIKCSNYVLSERTTQSALFWVTKSQHNDRCEVVVFVPSPPTMMQALIKEQRPHFLRPNPHICIWLADPFRCSVSDKPNMTDTDSVQGSFQRSNEQRQHSWGGGRGERGGKGVPKGQQTGVKVDFPNRHPRVSHQGTRVPLTLPQEQRLLSELIVHTGGVQATAGRGRGSLWPRSHLLSWPGGSIQFPFNWSVGGLAISLACGVDAFFGPKMKQSNLQPILFVLLSNLVLQWMIFCLIFCNWIPDSFPSNNKSTTCQNHWLSLFSPC